QVPPNQALPVRIVQDGGTLVLMFGKQETLADLKKGGGLAGVPAYQAAMAAVKKPAGTPALASYIDVTKSVTMVNDALAKIPNTPPEVREKVPLALDLMGINGLTQVA